MNSVAWIAEDITNLEELVEDAAPAEQVRALRRTLQRAFVEACKLSREMRHAEEALTPRTPARTAGQGAARRPATRGRSR